MAVSKQPKKPAAKKSTSKKTAVKKPASGGVFDISRPGKDALSPVVAVQGGGKRVLIRDEDADGVIDERDTAPVLTRPHKVVIQPLSDNGDQDQPVVDKPSKPAPTAAELVAKAEAAAQTPVKKVRVAAEDDVDVAPVEPTPTEGPVKPPILPSGPTSQLAKAAPPAQLKPLAKPAPPDNPGPLAEPKPDVSQPEITDASGAPVTVVDPKPAAGVPTLNREDKQLSPVQADEAARLDKERAAKLEEMVESEQYFLPIDAVQQRHNRRIALLGMLLVIVLALAWYDTALDANLVQNTYNLPHTHFFSVK